MKISSPCFVLALALFPLVAPATIVTTSMDEDNGSLGGGGGISLREAVKYSAPGSTINFGGQLSGRTIRLTRGEIVIDRTLIIDGSALSARITLSGDKTGNGRTSDDCRVLQITSGIVVINALIIADGFGDFGGGIRIKGSGTYFTVRNSTFTGNSASSSGGAIDFTGSPGDPNPALIIADSTFTGNSAATLGGAINTLGHLFIENTTLAGNSSASGGAIHMQDGPATIESSTLSGNTSSTEGGALYVKAGTFISRNSTYSGNIAGTTGGAIGARDGTLTFQNCTISANTAVGPGGGTGKTAAALVFTNTIVAGNFASHSPDTYSDFTGSNNLTSGDPRLAPLSDYGGPTPTMPPLFDSPAINAAGYPPVFATDQRGLPRQPKSDIGAVEFQGTTDLTRLWLTDFDGDGSSYGIEQALGTDPLVADSANPRNLTMPAINASGHAVLSFGTQYTPGTRWILKRSLDLSPNSFVEIYRTNRSTDTAAPGITFVRTPTRITVTDATPSARKAFYRLETVLTP